MAVMMRTSAQSYSDVPVDGSPEVDHFCFRQMTQLRSAFLTVPPALATPPAAQYSVRDEA